MRNFWTPSIFTGVFFGRDPVNQSLYLWSQTILVNTVLTYLGDRMEMASNSLA
jgi:hypothetical protein